MGKKLGFFLFLISFLGLFLWIETAVFAWQANNEISAPTEEKPLQGVVVVQGTAADPKFMRYELSFFHQEDPGRGWIVFAEGTQQVISGTLTIWDTTVGRNNNSPVFPDGHYQLRLRIVRTDYNYNEFFRNNLLIANDQPTPTATPLPSPETPTPWPSTTVVGAQSGVLPTLTPFLVPSLSPTVDLGATATAPRPTAVSAGLIEQIEQVNGARFSDAFWKGVTFTGLLFSLLATYLLMRAVWRQIKRRLFAPTSTSESDLSRQERRKIRDDLK